MLKAATGCAGPSTGPLQRSAWSALRLRLEECGLRLPALSTSHEKPEIQIVECNQLVFTCSPDTWAQLTPRASPRVCPR